ncbi:MAG: Ig-like domain-containing protein [Longimicrobiales bacterium]
MSFANALARSAPLALATSILLAACGGDDGGTDPDPVTISLSPTSLTLFVGDTEALAASVSGAGGATVNWTSSATGVAMVSTSGVVTAVGLGTATITATVAGEGASATAAVTVQPSSVAVAPATAEIGVDETVQLTATITGGSGLSVSWSSADETVATVDGDGLVTGVASGTVDVTAAVDGQPGVEAVAAITVTAPPSVSNVEFRDAQGQPLDLGDIGDLLVIGFDLEAEVGETVQVDVVAGDVVLASEAVTIQAALGVPEGMAAIRGSIRTEIAAPTPVVSFSGDQIEELVKGPRDLAVLLNGAPGVTTQATFNPSAHLFVRVVRADPVVLVNGRRVTNADMEVTAQLAYADQIQRIEIVTEGAAAVYGSDASAGVVNFILKADDRSGSGPTVFTSITGFDSQNGTHDVRLGTSALVRGGSVEEVYDFDREDPSYDGVFEASPPWYVGSNTALDQDLSLRAGWNATKWSDYSGIATHRFDVAAEATPNDWSYTGVSTGVDLTGLDGLPFRIRTRAVDPFGQFATRTLVDAGNGQPFMAYADLTPPTIQVAPGGIQPNALGIGTTATFRLESSDPPGVDGPAFSGVDVGSAWGRIRYDTPTGSTWLLGDGSGLVQAPDVFAAGSSFGIDALGPGVVRGEFSIADGAGNRSSFAIDASHNPNPPRVEGLSVSGTYDPTFSLSLAATYRDDADVLFGAGFTRYDGAAGGIGPLYLLPGFQQTGDPVDDQFNMDGTLNVQIDGFPHVIQLTETSFPQAPNGQRFPASTVGIGAFNSGGNFGWAEESVDGRFTLVDRVFGTTGDDHYEGLPGPGVLYNGLGSTGCGTLPQSHEYEFLSYTSGTFPADRAQLLYRKRLPGGLDVALPAGDPVDIVTTDQGGFFEGRATATLDATALNLGPEVIGVQWFLMSLFGEGLLTPLAALLIQPCPPPA